MKVEVEELEGLLGPEDVGVDLKRILKKKQEMKEGARYLGLSARMV